MSLRCSEWKYSRTWRMIWQTIMKKTVEIRSGGSLVRYIENACHVNFHMVLLIAGCSK
jgi:hypothetical protein